MLFLDIDNAASGDTPETGANDFVIRLADGAMGTDLVEEALAQMRDALGAELVDTTRKFGFQFWHSDTAITAETLASFAQTDWYGELVQAVSYIQPDYVVEAADFIPNDTRFDELWGLENTGQTAGTPGADINVTEAWDSSSGAGVLVAVIDTGVDYTHPDLAANMWINTGEIAGNGRDDDNNGYVDDVYGYDFAYDDGDPMDSAGHGTHVAGTIAAVGNNNQGVIGVAYDAQIMAVQFLDDSGSGSTSAAIRALEYAVLMGADLSNNSWGGGGYNQSLADAIELAGQQGHVFVAAAGNDSSNNDSIDNYPSNYTADNIIAVASTTHDDRLSSFSNYGRTTVDVAAPGSDILSTVPGGGYSSYSGTSMATPHVSGIVALMLDLDPTLTPDQIRQRLIDTSDPVAALATATVSGGRVNAAAALEEPTNGSITGTVWQDQNLNGVRERSEAVMAGVRVFLDTDNDGTWDEGERAVLTNASGAYLFDEVTPGTYTIAQEIPATYRQTTPTQTSGYTASTSDDSGGPVYDWNDIAALGTEITLEDDAFQSAALGDFSFAFFDQTYDTVYIASNGLLSFGAGTTEYVNRALPFSDGALPIIAGFWDDLNPSASESSHIYTYADTANGRFIIQYDNIYDYNDTGTVTYQMILEQDGSILFQYEDISAQSNSATIGIQDGLGNAVQLAYNESFVHDGLAVRFDPADATAAPHVARVSSGRTVVDMDFGNIQTVAPIAEFGQITGLTHTARTITLSRDFVDPVVFLFTTTANGAAPVTARLDAIGSDRFSVRLQEPAYLDDVHVPEDLSYVVLESGTWRLADGRILEVGTTSLTDTSAQGLTHVPLTAPFDGSELLFSQVQTDHGLDFVRSRLQADGNGGFDIALEEEEARNNSGHASERVGWFAIEEGSGSIGDLHLEAARVTVGSSAADLSFDESFDSAPLLLASIGSFNGLDPVGVQVRHLDDTGARLVLQEDQSEDNETGHIGEQVNVLAISGAGILSAEPVQPAAIIGNVWNDLDHDGNADSGERGLDGWVVYVDADGDGIRDADEHSTLSDDDGTYRLYGLGAGSHTIRAETPLGWIQTAPTSGADYEIETGPSVVYDWTDIRGLGTELTGLQDDSSQTVNLPFAFEFYGIEQTDLRVSSNGYLTFGNLGSSYSNTDLPNPDGPNNLIAAFWDDLNPAYGGSVHTYADTGNDRFIVQYQDVARYSGPGTYTFQTILEADGSIVFQYQSMTGSLGNASVGIENAAGTEGLQIATAGADLDQTAFRIVPPGFGEAAGHTVTLGTEGAVYGVDFGTYSNTTVMAEFGMIEALGTNAQTIMLEHRYINPVVFILPPSTNGAAAVTTRISDTTAGSFTVQLQEPNAQDGAHTPEAVSFMVIEAGAWELDDGTVLEVGELTTDLLTSAGYEQVSFDVDFAERPAVLTQVQTFNGRDFVQTRSRDADLDGFAVALEEEEALNNGQHASETIGYLAIQQGVGQWDGHLFEAAVTDAQVTAQFSALDFIATFAEAPQFFAATDGVRGTDPVGLRQRALTADGVMVHLSEDQSLDSETGHIPEAISYFAIAGDGTLTANPIAFTDTFDLVDLKAADTASMDEYWL